MSAIRQRRRPVQRRSQHMVDRILVAAARVLGTEGYAAMTTNRVAEEAGVSIGSLYRYFNDKAEIVEHLRARVNQEVLASLTEAILDSLDADVLVTTDYRSVLSEVVTRRFGVSVAQVFPGFAPTPVGVMA